MYFFWTADEIFDVHSICVQICYLMFYFSKTKAVCYHMHKLITRIRIFHSDSILFQVRIRMRQDFFLMRWNRIRFFFDEMRQNQIFFDEMRQNQTFFWWDETEPDSFFVRWDRIRFIFCEIKQNWTLIWWDETEQNWNKTECSDSNLHTNDNE